MIKKNFIFNCDKENRYIYTNYIDQDSYYSINVPLLKILKKNYENNNN